MDVMTVSLEADGAFLTIVWPDDNHKRSCSVKWLRVNCFCDRCKSSINKSVPSYDSVCIQEAEISEEDLICDIVNDNHLEHRCTIPLAFLRSSCNCEICVTKDIEQRKESATSHDKVVPYIEYEDVASGDEGLFCFLEMMMKRGFAIVRNFPTENHEIMNNFARSLGGIRGTLYGYDFNVNNKKSPTNAAYTAVKLPCHQDLPMYEHCPGVQYLLAVRFDDGVIGGESIIVDLFKCAAIFRENHPDHFRTFCRVSATFATIDMDRPVPVWLWHPKPHIEVDYFGEIVGVNWHPPLESTLRVRESDVEDYYKAHKAFRKIVQDPENQFVFRLRKGDMMIMNNHRMLHARMSFQSQQDGDRHLRGLYTNIDDMKSRYVTLANKLGKAVIPPKIGNRSSF